MNKNKIAFLVCSLTIAIYAECDTFSKFYSTDSLQKEIVALEKEFEKCKEPIKDSISSLQKEILALEKEIFETCNANTVDIEKCLRYIKSADNKNKVCREFKINVSKYYDSPDTTIDIRFILDGSCSEIRHFSITDKKNKTRNDSSFSLYGEHWETTKSTPEFYEHVTSWGIKQGSFYDNQGHRIRDYFINEKNDTTNSRQYFWENGKLTKTIFNGVERIFTYGTPCDSVRVDPTDYYLYLDGFNPPQIYDKSFGKIPEEEDNEYQKFKMSPYQYYAPSELLEKQKRRCEEYKETQKKKGKK